MNFLSSLFRIIYGLYALLMFVLIMLLIFPLVLAAAAWGVIRGGNMIYRLCMFWGDIWFFLIGIHHRNIYESPHDREKQYIFVSNHISYLDAPVIVKTFRQPLRALGKTEMSVLPVFGFIYKYAVVRVDRGNASHRAKSVRNMKSVIRKGISLIVFPEGTFNMTRLPLKDFYDGAFRVAIETQTPLKPVLFLDTYDRMHYKSLFTLNPGKSRSVFLEEVPVHGLTLKEVPFLKQKVFSLMEKKLTEYQAGWILPASPL